MKSQVGQMFIELVLTIGIALILLPSLLTGFVATREGKAQQNQRLEAVGLLKESQEAVRSFREKNWNTFAINGTYHPQIASGSWSLISGSEQINGYTRQIVISDILRDATGAIVSQNGNIDPSTKKVVSTVSWTSPFFSNVTSTQYLTRFAGNTVYSQTSVSDFNTGSKSGVLVTNTSGGEVTLGGGGSGDWCSPNLSISAIDLPKSGVANAISAIEGKVFAGTGENASGVSYATVSISNANPPTGEILGTFSNYKTNDVFGVSNYSYIATDTNNKEIIILDVSVTPYTEIGFFDAPGADDATSVFVVNNTGYMTSGEKLYAFDLTETTGSRPILEPDGVTLSGEGEEVVVVGNYAYIAIGDDSSKEMQIVDVANPLSLRRLGYGDADPARLNSGEKGKDIFVNQAGTRAYVAVNGKAGFPDFFIFDTSTKTGSRPIIGKYEANGMTAKGITVVPGNRAILVGTGGEEYQVINIATESGPVRCGGLNIDSGVHGISSVIEGDGDAYSYIITGDANAELKIIQGGAGGTFSLNGTFESSTFSLDNDVAFNYLDFVSQTPVGTTLMLQVGIAHKNSETNDCSNVTYAYVGPDGTPTSYFTASDAIPASTAASGFVNPGQCFRYKAFLSSTDQIVSPTLYDVTVNYSP